MNVTNIIDLKNIIVIKKLNAGNGGIINISKIITSNIEEYKLRTIKMLYPSLDETNDLNACNINFKTTTKYNKISESIIDKRYIMSRNKVIDVKNIVFIKKLNIKNGGQIQIDNINLKNLEEYKKIIIDTLYPSQ